MTDNKDPLQYRYLWIALGVVYIGFIIWISIAPSPPGKDLPINDKLAHWIIYFMLMLWFLQLAGSFEERALLATAFIFMGLSLEFMQGLIDARTKELGDGIANTLGVLAGVSLYRTPAAGLLRRFEGVLERLPLHRDN